MIESNPSPQFRRWRLHESFAGPTGAEHWDRVIAGLADRTELHDAWLNGLSWNSAATGSVLWRLTSASRRLEYGSLWVESRDLTQEAGAVLVRHPDRTIRRDLVQNPSLSLDALAVLAKDPDQLVQRAALESIEWRNRALNQALASKHYYPERRVVTSAGPPPKVGTRGTALAAARSPQLPSSVMHKLLDHAGVDPGQPD